MSERWHPREGQLATHAAGALEDAYGNRARVRCSRDDVADGWLACLAYVAELAAAQVRAALGQGEGEA